MPATIKTIVHYQLSIINYPLSIKNAIFANQ